MIASKFSRTAFEESLDPAALGAELSREILPRLAGAGDPAAEVLAIVEDLRQLGHSLWSWDESTDFAIWGDDYVRPASPNRFLIEMMWPDEADAASQGFQVEVTFGPWPAGASTG